MDADYDRSLDEIIKQRNIRSNVGGAKSGGGGGALKPVSLLSKLTTTTGGGAYRPKVTGSRPKAKIEDARDKLIMNQRVNVKDARNKIVMNKRVNMKDARNKLIMNKRVKMKDARERLNQRVGVVTDARERLNRIGVNKGNKNNNNNNGGGRSAFAALSRFQLGNPGAIRLTRTVNNRLEDHIRPNVNTKSTISTGGSGIREGEFKKVFLTGSGITVNTLTRPAARIPSSGNLFARTVSSLAQDALFQSGFNTQEARNPIYERKRKMMEEDEYELEYESLPAHGLLDAKRLKFSSEPSSSVLLRQRTSLASSSSSRLSPGLQSRLGGAEDPLAGPSSSSFSSSSSLLAPPPQGFKVLVSNLHAIVTQQDLVELFGDLGPLRKVTLVRPGSAEVTFANRLDARKAIDNYHNRELDGQPMICKLVDPAARLTSDLRANPNAAAAAADASSLLRSSGGVMKVGTLRSDHVGSEPRVKSRVAPDLGVIHKALFHRTFPQTPRTSIVVTM